MLSKFREDFGEHYEGLRIANRIFGLKFRVGA